MFVARGIALTYIQGVANSTAASDEQIVKLYRQGAASQSGVCEHRADVVSLTTLSLSGRPPPKFGRRSGTFRIDANGLSPYSSTSLCRSEV